MNLKILFPFVAIVLVALWINRRWKAWFYNPPEAPYILQDSPDRILLTFGNSGEMSRFVSWACGSEVDTEAKLLLSDVSDTTSVHAIGEVFESRSGRGAYYRAEMTNLKPSHEYFYCVESYGKRSSWYRFKTSDPKSSQFSFMYIGDVQDSIGGITSQLIHNAIIKNPEIEFIAFGGDLILRPTDRHWAEFFKSMDTLCTTIPIVNVPGNHEYLKYLKRKCERRFSLVFPYFIKGINQRQDNNHLFSFSCHNTDFFLLDSSRGFGYLYRQRRWLEHQLEESRSSHHVVIVHHPIYSAKHCNNNLEVRLMFNDIIQKHNVDLVLQGHEHVYTRCTSEGNLKEGSICKTKPLYLISHCSPKNYNIKSGGRFSPVFCGSRYFHIIQTSNDDMTVRTYDAMDCNLLDSVVIK